MKENKETIRCKCGNNDNFDFNYDWSKIHLY